MGGGSGGAAGAPPAGEGGNGGVAAGGASGEGGTVAGGAGGAGGGAVPDPTLVELAVEAGTFTSLVAALEAADLAEALSGEGPFTVFAPDDAAFAAFEQENPGVLASLSTDELTAVLTYHVLAAEVLSTDLVDGSIAETLNGAYVGIELGDGVKVGGANVTEADLVASNGVIHVIDRLILPPGENLVET
ncbi:MAG TPA: fasciclin domain-containing protein, partial [Polyangiaceae bacterium]|nr:fasciclin domain-containing protein [Polyangiaceae bacterium]